MDTTTTTTKIDKYASYESKIEAQKAELKAKDRRIAELERQLAEAQRQNALLRAAIESQVDSMEKIIAYTMSVNPAVAFAVSGLIDTEKLQAAIDGGAM